MLAGLKLAVTPLGRPLAERATAPLNPPAVAEVMVVVAPVPCCAVTEAGLAVSVMLGDVLEVTVSEMAVVLVTPPPVPVTVMVYAPTAALLLAVSVKVEVPDPGEAMLVGLKPAVTPAGMPLADRATALLNPPTTADVIVEVPLAPWFTVTDAGLGVSVKLGEVLAVTVSETVVVSVSPPPVPVMVIV